ncbi:PucR family transcriptional regulator [Yinghuangia seranimata]|uniref:PucR family transcriptional regulator n=1 Tax=Yinghuangia seranimata TaxID=408067 RepID=UPI00248A8F4C|nr:helix-turn-helix domain-containing protein [Yinghuangia seranimata]MDI2128103.1 helix-turn-helix domain-containing protein [Yinghuangia seranimata]
MHVAIPPGLSAEGVGPAASEAAAEPAAESAAEPTAEPLGEPPDRPRAAGPGPDDLPHNRLLRRAARALMERLPELTDRLVAAVYEQEAAYRDGPVPADELWQGCHESLRSALLVLMVPHGQGEPSPQTWRLGRRRAEQGLPLDALLHAYRIGGVLVWQALVETTVAQDLDGVRELVHAATTVWRVVDHHSTLVSDAYRSFAHELTSRHHERTRALLDALLDGRADAADLSAASAVLDLPEEGRYAVAMLRHGRPGTGQHDGPRPTGVEGAHLLWRSRADAEFAVALLHKGADDADALAGLAKAVGPSASSRAGVGLVVDGLPALARARRQAEIALRTCTVDGEVARLDERLPAALVACQPDLSSALATRTFGQVLALDAADRELLLGTLAAWFDAGGSAARAGARLFCHRNTVLNRLRRFEQLSGRDLGLPRDLVELGLALDAYRLTGV